MNILALDTSTNTLHLAIKGDDFYEERMISEKLQHSDAMLGKIKELLALHELEIKDLNLLLCTQGPGAFTSLRISMSTLKGFSVALGLPLVTVPTLDVLSDIVSFFPGAILPVIDAKKNRYYLGLYQDGQSVIKSLDGNAENIIDSVNKMERVLVTGPDCQAFAKKLLALEPSAQIFVDNEEKRNCCQSLIRLGLEQFEKRGADDIGQGPVYIRRSDAEEALLQKKNKEYLV